MWIFALANNIQFSIMRFLNTLTQTALICLALSSCIVSKQKYDELLAENVQMEGEIAQLTADLETANAKIASLNASLDSLNEVNSATSADLQKTSTDLSALRGEQEKLQTLYDNLLKNSGKLNRDLSEQQERLLTMERDLELATEKNNELSESLAQREKKVSELERILADKEKAVNDLKNKVSAALLNFEENDLKIDVRNGKVYVSLAEQLLFRSGSVKVDTKGVNALQQLATVLKESPDINVMVEGHTDNVPISRSSQYMNDNWDLSVMRATSIVRILTRGGVDAAQITASGKGEHTPVVENDTAENKAKNRRTEIILTPKLDELFEILESN